MFYITPPVYLIDKETNMALFPNGEFTNVTPGKKYVVNNGIGHVQITCNTCTFSSGFRGIMHYMYSVYNVLYRFPCYSSDQSFFLIKKPQNIVIFPQKSGKFDIIEGSGEFVVVTDDGFF